MSYPRPNGHKNAITRADDPERIFVTPIQGRDAAICDWRAVVAEATAAESDDLEAREELFSAAAIEAFLTENVDFGFENLEVRLVEVPDIRKMQIDAAIGNVAHVGGNHSPIEVLEELGAHYGQEGWLTEEMRAELMNSGLEQTFESQMFSFLVYGCSRGFTHEMVRTRNGASYNQQTFRHTDLTNTRFRMPAAIAANPQERNAWAESHMVALWNYEEAVNRGFAYEDARTYLTMATETYILVRMPWRTFVDTFAYRACYMFYPEMVNVMHQLYGLLEARAPELTRFLKITCETSKTCTYRGAEPTGHGACPFLWAGRRNWLPDQDKRWTGREYLNVQQWDEKYPERKSWIEMGARTDADVIFDQDGLVKGGSSEWDNRK